MPRKYAKPIKPGYDDIVTLVEYDPEKGTFTRTRITGSNQKLGPLRPSPSHTLTVNGYSLTYNQIAYILVNGEAPAVRLTHKDRDKLNFKWSNIVVIERTTPDQTRSIYTEFINGKEMDVDNSKLEQPLSESSEMRQRGQCNACGNQPVCLEHEFIGACLGRISRESTTHQYLRMQRAKDALRCG